ncbi:MAG: hypothetical protein A2848_02070 [Candidatus Magasanikbacteria bacterium RIFCSPHIGHO2_01_FULL_50_8]|uniref:Peptidoglycan binding-like domain-containing protein n=1 Tax=Candidatus Magasanikbacteria bacterium RIFCSPHIGHO2_01_FULL_50_8 TaxID=1798674 RepID=A0A1F6LSD2_9BACT|nr:MAG: hypothetical protein A2848_02070 [Candidatus Magasanikbacteria bacterium RIFCSPHIGHO2_01_FULL_50_8]
MSKHLLKGVVLGGLLGGLAVWAHTTPKGKQTKAAVEARVKALWAQLEKEYRKMDPDGVAGLKKQAATALKSWQKSKDLSADVKKSLGWVVKKLV